MGRGGMKGRDGGGGGGGINVVNSEDIWSYRHGAGNAPFSDAVNEGLRAIDNDFPGFAAGINTVDAVDISGRGKNTILGYWDAQNKQLGMNKTFQNQETMNKVMDDAARSGFHPSRGNKSGTEAVAIHESGHALTDYLADKNGYPGLHAFSEKVVKDAYKNSGAKGGTKSFAGTISKYAQKNYAETVAEAAADWYCNGNKASSASKAIMSELKKYS